MTFDEATKKLRDLQFAFAGPALRKRVDRLFARLVLDMSPDTVNTFCCRVADMDGYDRLTFLVEVRTLCNDFGIPK